MSGVNRILGPHDGVVIGIGHALTSVLQGSLRDHFRSRILTQPFDLSRLGNIPVLTKLATKVATRSPEREDARAWKEMVERFFFDGIDANSGATTIRRKHHALVTILADETKAAITRLQVAFARA